MQTKRTLLTKNVIKQSSQRRVWKRVVAGLACVVVLVTAYMVILPALTLEKPTYCGLEEHQHNTSCYQQALVCEQEEGSSHTHSDACYTQVLICNKQEHKHTLACYSNNAADVETAEV